MADFSCQVLNRDIWKDDAIKALVKENFIFLQYTKDDDRAQQYISYYMAGGRHENPDNYPHVAIIDPRTGEQVKVWSGRPFPDALEFHAQLAEFLDRYSLSANSKNPVAKQKARQPAKDVDRMTEDEMLEWALQNSLEGTNGGTSSAAAPTVEDPDDLTASTGGLDEGKGKEPAREEPAAEPAASPQQPTAAESTFTQIPSDKPHKEPDQGPTVGRIQFRHPAGRVIRRFDVGDSVQRIYEWLKSEPLEGKEGVQFELKLMPQGRDLIEDLDKTVDEAGLKNSTVMIEFI